MLGQSSQPGQPPAYQNPSKSKNKPVGSANIVATSDDEWDGYWSVAFISNVFGFEVKVTPLECKEAGTDTTLSGRFAAAALTQVEEGRTARVKLYDSGATRHISPYCDDFITY